MHVCLDLLLITGSVVHMIFYVDVTPMQLPVVDFACKVVLEKEVHIVQPCYERNFSLILVEIESVF